MKYAIRIPSNDSLERDIAELLMRPVGRPGRTVCSSGWSRPAAGWSSMPGTSG